ncbi:hypothetical protein DXG01_006429 [Tephrocybe rancida]|nr:hypothetical protein DXG01_006429 [Tephrocybe rancida]
MSYSIFEHHVFSAIQNLKVLLAALTSWHLPPLLNIVKSVAFLLDPAPTQTIKILEPTRVLPAPTQTSTALHHFIGPLQYAAIVMFAAVALCGLMGVIWSIVEYTLYCGFGVPAKSDSPKIGYTVLLVSILTLGLLSGAQYACSCLGLDLVQLAPLTFIGTALLNSFSWIHLSVDLDVLLGPLKHGFVAMFTAAANGVPPVSCTLVRAMLIELTRVPSTPQTRLPVDLEYLFGPLKCSFVTVFTTAASDVRSICTALFALTRVPFVPKIRLSVEIKHIIGPLKHSFIKMFPAAASGVRSMSCTIVHNTLFLLTRVPALPQLPLVDLDIFIGPLKYGFSSVFTAAAIGTIWVAVVYLRSYHRSSRLAKNQSGASFNRGKDVGAGLELQGPIISTDASNSNLATIEVPTGPPQAISAEYDDPPILELPAIPLQVPDAPFANEMAFGSPGYSASLDSRYPTWLVILVLEKMIGEYQLEHADARERELHTFYDESLNELHAHCDELREENRVLTGEVAPPNYAQAVEGAFDEWSTAVVSGAAASPIPDSSFGEGEDVVAGLDLQGLMSSTDASNSSIANIEVLAEPRQAISAEYGDQLILELPAISLRFPDAPFSTAIPFGSPGHSPFLDSRYPAWLVTLVLDKMVDEYQLEYADARERELHAFYDESLNELHAYCDELREENRVLRGEVAPPNYARGLAEGAFDEWSAAVVSSAAAFPIPDYYAATHAY